MSFLLALFIALGTPCPSEDTHGCYWDAAHRGNGVGTSFVDVAGRPFYLAEVTR